MVEANSAVLFSKICGSVHISLYRACSVHISLYPRTILRDLWFNVTQADSLSVFNA
jgi:hypothetical protein